MTSIDEKRVYSDREGTQTVSVATELGVVRVELSADIVGEFSMVHRCDARDVAASGDSFAVATDEDVLDGDFASLGFGSAIAVGFDGDDLLAVDEDGILARYDEKWHELASLADVRAIDGNLVATEDGVYQVSGDGVRHVGLESARDVSTAGVPLAATDDGLYRLGNGWMEARSGAFRVVSGTEERAYAATADSLFVRDGDDWVPVSLPTDEPIVDVGLGDGVYVVTESGTLLATVGDEWRSRHLGLMGVTALAVH